MKIHRSTLPMTLAALITLAIVLPASTWAADAPKMKMKMTTEIPHEITTPDKVETRLGKLEVVKRSPLGRILGDDRMFFNVGQAVERYQKKVISDQVIGLQEENR
jgi:hypothetical protein